MRPKKIIGLSIILMSLLGTLFFTPWTLLGLWLSPLAENPQQELNNIVDYDIEGCILYVDHAGKAPQSYAAGFNNRAAKTKADPQSLFRIASISKLYIAAAATKVIQSGKLSLDDKLEHLLPFLKGRVQYADQISLKMLIQHRSGIPNYINHPDFPWFDLFKENRPALDLVLDSEADFKPGTKYAYSNTNYLLLAAILDSTLGYSHHRYIDSNLLMPLGLSHTFNQESEIDTSQLMSAYFPDYEPDIKGNNYIHPGGSMIATAEDVGRFVRALNDGSLFTAEENSLYEELYPREHTGHLPGYVSIARYDAELDAVIVLFMNTSGDEAWGLLEGCYRRVRKILAREE